MSGKLLAAIACLTIACVGCSSINLGVGIPGTPVSVGTSIPVKNQGGWGDDNIRYIDVDVRTDPAGARLKVDGQFIGTSPARVALPFRKGSWGKAKGSCLLVVERPGYLSEAVRVYAVSGKHVSLTNGGKKTDEIFIDLRSGKF